MCEITDFIDAMSARINEKFAALPEDRKDAFHEICRTQAEHFVETMLTKGPPEFFILCFKEAAKRRNGQLDPLDVAVMTYISTHPAFAHLMSTPE